MTTYHDETVYTVFPGWTIDRISFTEGVEGGLTFHMTKGSKTRVVVLGYTELGEWIHSVEEGKQ